MTFVALKMREIETGKCYEAIIFWPSLELCELYELDHSGQYFRVNQDWVVSEKMKLEEVRVDPLKASADLISNLVQGVRNLFLSHAQPIVFQKKNTPRKGFFDLSSRPSC